MDPENHCKGRMQFERRGYLCFSYDVDEFPEGPYDYFRSFPILRFILKSDPNEKGQGSTFNLDWYPSEYLYREKSDRYCVAVDVSEQGYLTFGGTLMRQHMFAFDIENNRLGIARASCSDDPNQIFTEQELIDGGQCYSLDPEHTESYDEECEHIGSYIRPPRTKHPAQTQSSPRPTPPRDDAEVSPPEEDNSSETPSSTESVTTSEIENPSYDQGASQYAQEKPLSPGAATQSGFPAKPSESSAIMSKVLDVFGLVLSVLCCYTCL